MITLVHDQEGDWIALYKDGRLLKQGHSFEADELLRLVGLEPEVIWDATALQAGFFPDDLKDVVRT